MELKRILNSSHPEIKELITLHGSTFPEYERFKATPLLANLINNEQSMFFNAVYENNELAGFFIYWDLETCYYIHFIAIFPEMRNKKTGQQILDWISDHLHQPVFLEAEIPFDEITARRINFYKRNGYLELAHNPETLAKERRGGHPLSFMGNQPVVNLESYMIKIKEKVYNATGE